MGKHSPNRPPNVGTIQARNVHATTNAKGQRFSDVGNRRPRKASQRMGWPHGKKVEIKCWLLKRIVIDCFELWEKWQQKMKKYWFAKCAREKMEPRANGVEKSKFGGGGIHATTGRSAPTATKICSTKGKKSSWLLEKIVIDCLKLWEKRKNSGI